MRTSNEHVILLSYNRENSVLIHPPKNQDILEHAPLVITITLFTPVEWGTARKSQINQLHQLPAHKQ